MLLVYGQFVKNSIIFLNKDFCPSSVEHFFRILLCLKVTVFRKISEIRLSFVNLYQELKYVINSFYEDDLQWKMTFDGG